MSKMILAILIQFYQLLLMICKVVLVEPNNRNMWADYRMTPQRRLDSDVLKVLEGTTAIKCAAVSSKHYGHAPFNFKSDNGAFMGRCTIVSGCNRLLSLDKNLTIDKDHRFYQLTEFQPSPCDKNPCRNGGRCDVTRTDNGGNLDFTCNCHFPTTGRTCNEIDCGGATCIRFNNTYFFIYRNKTKDWDAWKSWCEAQGLDMAMPKDESTNTFLRSYFLDKMYSGDMLTKHAFYIGLRRAALNKPFKWTDGEELGSYRPWCSKGVDRDLCVCIANGADFQFFWDADPCTITNTDSWKYYGFCQKYCPFLEN